MISFKLQVILLIATIIIFITLINMVSKYKLDLKYALLWLVLGATFIVLSIYPPIVYKISELISIETPANSIFLLGILFLLAIVFSLTIAISRASNKIKILSQELGLLKNEISILAKYIKQKE